MRRALIPTAAIALLAAAAPAAACADFAQAPSSRWSTVAERGASWLVTPCGDRFYSVGINVVDGGEYSSNPEDTYEKPPATPDRFARGRKRYVWPAFHPTLADWVAGARARMDAWGFNTAGAWSLPPRTLPLPTMVDLEVGRRSRFHWFDPFDPVAETVMRAKMAELVAPYRGDPLRIGYFSDNEVGWWGGALFAHYSGQPAANRTKQRWLETLRQDYADDWARFAADFVPPEGVGSWRDLLNSERRVKLRPGGRGIRAVERWTYVIASHYYETTARLLREADPGALFFGDRLPTYYDPAAVRAMAPHVDVVSTNYNPDSHDGWIARYYFDGLRRLTGGKPILVSEWFFAAHENRSGARNIGHLMTVATQAERAAGAAEAIRQFAAIPEVLGQHWFQYHDHPEGGRSDGEDYNFGLVDLDNRPYEELVRAIAPLNRELRAGRGRAPARPSAAARPVRLPMARIDATDKSLRDWPKPAALLPPLAASPGAIPFGEVYAAWSAEGLAFALISQDYHDLDLFDHPGEFPLAEAFRLGLGIDGGAGPRWFTLYFIPPKAAERARDEHAYRMRAMLCDGPALRHAGAACSARSGGAASYFGSDQPRITAEVLLPWSALGLEQAPEARRIRFEVAVTAWHRSRWMSLTGGDPDAGLARPGSWEEGELVVARVAD
jgi:hypothetical protein